MMMKMMSVAKKLRMNPHDASTPPRMTLTLQLNLLINILANTPGTDEKMHIYIITFKISDRTITCKNKCTSLKARTE